MINLIVTKFKYLKIFLIVKDINMIIYDYYIINKKFVLLFIISKFKHN